jgi:hypothetical protein
VIYNITWRAWRGLGSTELPRTSGHLRMRTRHDEAVKPWLRASLLTQADRYLAKHDADWAGCPSRVLHIEKGQ